VAWRAKFPFKNDPRQTRRAGESSADKEREASDAHDGTWVAHPGLVAMAKEPSKGHERPDPASTRSAMTSTSAPRPLNFQPRGHHRPACAPHHIGIRTWAPGLPAPLCADIQPDGRPRRGNFAGADWHWIRSPLGIWTMAARSPGSYSVTGAAGTRKSAAIADATRVSPPGNIRRVPGVRGADACRRLVEFLTLPAYDYHHARAR